MSASSRISLVRRTLAPLVCVLTFGIALLVWFDSTGNPLSYFAAEVPPGQTLYVFSKLCALLGIVMLWFQMMAALARTTPALRGFPTLHGRAHAVFGVASFALILLHLFLFMAASTIRTGHAAFDLLLPTLEHGHYRAMLGLGAIATWLLLLVVIAGWRRVRGSSTAKWLHRAVFVAMCLGFLHGMTVGSETRFGLMQYVYAFMGLSLGTAVLSWCWQAVQRSRFAVVTPSSLVAGSGPRAE